MRTITFTLPLLPGQQEAWRRCLQEMLDVYRTDYEALQHQLGVRRLVLWLTETPYGDMVIVQIEAEELEALLPNLVASDFPLAGFLRQRVLELHGLDLAQPTRMVTELVHEG
jgi:hypothetical protein